MVMERLACGATVVWTRALVLLAVFGSEVAELTEAELEIWPPCAGAVTLMTMLGAVATARLVRVQVTVAVPLQAQPLPLALTSVTPGGRESLTLTADAAFGPTLLTLRV